MAVRGAECIQPIAMGDELGGQQAAFLAWRKLVCAKVNSLLGIPPSELAEADPLVPQHIFKFDFHLALASPAVSLCAMPMSELVLASA